MRPLTCAEIRELDRRAIQDFGLPGVVLMENAGRSAAELLVQLGAAGRVVIVCGKGNNAGDGFVMARHLANRSIDVEVFLAAAPESLSGDAAVFYRVLAQSRTPLRDLSQASPAEWAQAFADRQPIWIVDALLGTGLRGPAREPFAGVIETINAAGVPIFAVDLPSGLDGDAGIPAGASLRAQYTGTFAARKIGFDNPASRAWTGEVHVLDIGLPAGLTGEMSRDP
jgi:NAD(P)H-hydrate epimerase